MPRKIRGIDEKPRPINGNLAERLADELRNSRESGQPMVEEEAFAAGKRGVSVIWMPGIASPLRNAPRSSSRRMNLPKVTSTEKRSLLPVG